MTLYQCRLHSGDLKFVVAEDGADALRFLGVSDGSASVHAVAYNVEVVGLHPAHPPIPPIAPTVPPRDLSKITFMPFSGRPGCDTRSADGFRAEDYAAECAQGTCDCTPTCGLCGKGIMWDEKKLPGWHDWTCPHCLSSGNHPWKEAVNV